MFMMISLFISMMFSFSVSPFFFLLSVKLPWSEFGITQKHLSRRDRSVCHIVAWLRTKSLEVITTHSWLCLEWPLLEFVAGDWRKMVNSSEVFFVIFSPLERSYHQPVPSGFYPGWELRPFKHFFFYTDRVSFIIQTFLKSATFVTFLSPWQKRDIFVGEKQVRFYKCSIYGFYRSVVSITLREAKSILCRWWECLTWLYVVGERGQLQVFLLYFYPLKEGRKGRIMVENLERTWWK